MFGKGALSPNCENSKFENERNPNHLISCLFRLAGQIAHGPSWVLDVSTLPGKHDTSKIVQRPSRTMLRCYFGSRLHFRSITVSGMTFLGMSFRCVVRLRIYLCIAQAMGDTQMEGWLTVCMKRVHVCAFVRLRLQNCEMDDAECCTCSWCRSIGENETNKDLISNVIS